MSKGRADRRWRTFVKYVSRIKKRLHWMKIQYDEYEADFNGVKYKKTLWRNPRDWKEADGVDSTGSKSLKDTPTPYKEPWKDVYNRKRIKNIRDESKHIIDDQINDELKK